LSPLLAPADNAAMEADPSKADLPKRKRRRFQFRLRTLLIVVTLLAGICAYVEREAKMTSGDGGKSLTLPSSPLLIGQFADR
jgi:hypothetical protein